MASIGLCSSSDITFDKNSHNVCSSSAGRKVSSNDTQISMIGSTEPEMCMKMLQNFNEILKAKLPSTTLGYSMIRFSCIDDAFPEILELEACTGEGQPLQRKRRKGEKKKKKLQKPKSLKVSGPKNSQNFDLSKNTILVVKHAVVMQIPLWVANLA